MRKKIAVVGDKGSVLGFKSVGFEVFMTTTQQETREVMQALCKADYGIIFITEQALAPILPILNDYKDRRIPAIIPIPDSHGTSGVAMANIKANVEKAIGADILFAEEK